MFKITYLYNVDGRVALLKRERKKYKRWLFRVIFLKERESEAGGAGLNAHLSAERLADYVENVCFPIPVTGEKLV